MKIYIVNGQGACGKSTFEKFVQEFGEADSNLIKIDSIINPVKTLAQYKFGYVEELKDLRDRAFLCNLKNILDEYCDYSYIKLKESIEMSNLIGYDVIFIDAREDEDIQRLINDFGAKTILIKRGENKTYGNIADDSVAHSKINYSFVLENNGTLEDWRAAAYKFYRNEIEEIEPYGD